jgi:cell division septation protein DedD/nucleoid DNA-binding protein
MDIDIGNYIGLLLYKNKTVALPGLGSFEAAYQPAVIDQVQGELHPPGKTISFNPNLVSDDGLLSGMVEERYGVSATDASQMLESYVKEVREAIGRREIVVFNKVGRLYRDYEDNLQFLPDGNNYDVESYGLPTISFYPVARSARPPHSKEQPRKAAPRAIPAKSAQAANNGLIAAIAAATIVVGVAVYFLIFGTDTGQEQSMQPVPTSRVNVRPGDQAATATVPEEGGSEPVDSSTAGIENPTEESADTERPTPVPGQQSYVIIVGVFGNPQNVKQLIDDIYDAGYEPYTEKAGKLTKVGVQRTYRSEAEIEAAIKDVRNRFTKDAKLYRW